MALQVANNPVEANTEPAKESVLANTTEVFGEYYPLFQHLNASTSSAKRKIFDHWKEIKKDHGDPGSEESMPETNI